MPPGGINSSRTSSADKTLGQSQPSHRAPPPPYLSGSSRNSVSEASKAVEPGRKGDSSSQRRRRTVLGELEPEEKRGGASSTRLRVIARATSTTAIIHPNVTSTKTPGQNPLPSPAHIVTPAQSSPIKNRGRITLRPQSLHGSTAGPAKLFNFARPAAPANPQSGEQDAEDASSKTAKEAPASKRYEPKQKIKPLFPVLGGAKSDKGKSTIFVTSKPLDRLAEPEEGEWDAMGVWREKPRAKGISSGGDVAKTRDVSVEKPLSTAAEQGDSGTAATFRQSVIQAGNYPSPRTSPMSYHKTPHVRPEVCEPPRATPGYPRQATSAPPTQPVSKYVPLFLTDSNEDLEDLINVHKRYDPRVSPPAPAAELPSRPFTQREYAVSQDSRAPSQLITSSVQKLESSSASSNSSTDLSDAAGTSHGIKGARSEPRLRSDGSPLKTLQTYGTKTKSMIPPPAAKRSRKDERAARKARYGKQEHREAAAAEAAAIQTRSARRRAMSAARKRDRHPTSGMRGEEAPGKQRYPTYEIDGHIGQRSGLNGNAADDPFVGHQICQVGSQSFFPNPGIHAHSEESQVGPEGALVAAEVAEIGDDGVLTKATPAEAWSRVPHEVPGAPDRKRKRRSRRRHLSVSYHYRDDNRSLSPLGEQYYQTGPQPTGRSHSKRAASTSNWLDDRALVPASNDELEQSLDKRKRSKRSKRNGAWPLPGLFQPSSPLSHKARHGAAMQPLSEYPDPREADRDYQLAENGMYVLLPSRKLANTTGRRSHPHRHRREHNLDTPARLKLSRRESAKDHANEYVNKVAEHSKSSRANRPKPIRPLVRKAKDLPAYTMKPIQKVTWEEYNAAYNDERPFPIDQGLIQKSMAALRAEYFRSAGRPRPSRSRAEREKLDHRREESRIEGMNGIEEGVDTFTPSLRPIPSADETASRYVAPTARLPRLQFTARTPSPPPLPARWQKRKVSRLLQPGRGDDEDDGTWDATTGRPDPINADSSGEEDHRDGTAGAVHRPVPASSQARLPLPGKLHMRPRPDYSADAPPDHVATSNPTSDPDDLISYVEQHLGDELDRIVARNPEVNAEIRAMLAQERAGGTGDAIAVDEDDADYPSVPSHPASAGGASTPRVISSSHSRMMTGAAMTSHLLEALQQTKAMFAAAPDTSERTCGNGGVKSSARTDARKQRIAAQARIKKLQAGAASSKGKGRHFAEGREKEKEESQLSLNFRPRGRQLPSRADIPIPTEDAGTQIQPATARVLVAPQPVAIQAPRLGLSRSASRRYPDPVTPTATHRPAKGIMTDLVRRPFRPPTQALLNRSTGRPSRLLPDAAALTAEDDGTLAYQPAQPMPTDTQATTAVPPTQATSYRSRSRLQSIARVSTTDKDSSPADLPSSEVPGSEGSTARQLRASRSDASWSDPRGTAVSRPAPRAPTMTLRKKSFSSVMPKAGILKRTDRMVDHGASGREAVSAPARGVNTGVALDDMYVAAAGGDQGRRGIEYGVQAESTGGRGSKTAGGDEEVMGLDKNRISSQRARKPFRPPTSINRLPPSRALTGGRSGFFEESQPGETQDCGR